MLEDWGCGKRKGVTCGAWYMPLWVEICEKQTVDKSRLPEARLTCQTRGKDTCDVFVLF